MPNLKRGPGLRQQGAGVQNDLVTQLYEQIGHLKMALEWLQEVCPSSTDDKRMMINIHLNCRKTIR